MAGQNRGNLFAGLSVARGCGNNDVPLAAAGRAGGEESARLTRGLRTEEMSPGKHCENVTATLTAGQFSKSNAAGHFPLCVGTKSQGGKPGSVGGD